MVLVILNRLGTKEMSKLMAARVLISPLLDSRKHVALDLDVIVACSRMVESTDNVVDDLVDGNIGILPSIEHTGD